MSDRVQALCAALGVPATPAQADLAEKFLAILSSWNAVYNLTSVRDPEAMVTQHLADCLAVLPSLSARRAVGRVLDVGSGGGLPGVVIAIFAPWVQVCCVDTVGKKAAFVRQVAASLSLSNLSSVHGRVESLHLPAFDVVTSRAFATLDAFVSLTRGLLAPTGAWMAMKGKEPADEMAALPSDVEVFHVEHLHVPGLDAQRCLVWMQLKSPSTPGQTLPGA